MSIYRGSGVAIVTPYQDTEAREINYEVFRQLVERQIEAGTDAIIVAGTTGEASNQTDEEQIDLIRYCIEVVDQRVPVIAGAGSNDTRHGVNLSKECEAAGADALLSVTPYYLKTNQEGLYQHFAAIAKAVNIPIILYDVPGRTGMGIAPQTLRRLIDDFENIVGLKDATGNFNHAVDNLHYCGDQVDVYSGNDDTAVPLMSLGGQGVISVLANIAPKEVHDMIHAALDGDFAKARELQAKFKPLIDTLFCEPNPIPVKAALAIQGFEVGPTRLPLGQPQAETVNKLKEQMDELGLLNK
ncbi:4-hydroxy-tetrahydrodipicolinate synthase [Aerococcus sanguinicola]|uniref:4-hydroxy-tetrahydrodipicolinate synthase n=1 Tax=unclassified Aerococcus TaxID=2618060 RepID=UPI0008A57B12|nr:MULTISPECIES: 4-hydroxy-tetrahydrodipicolinate synthase [unclassified Aerococcus]KAB0647924.1 4-hydroxy-tetrahydrodipicolinate synthase [Aerococcus sanguinicola]MDK6233419.1 4-hydroxy-tetrahydrodipicolinate synthase [Aerococcus sp. UMB10185]MDK6855598.1 4-hydroxy-tetrahydrodipicolinate synthase [Aerococcus sp. UMB7533]MDK8502317.1 4-hydroxy-tetrahydrodipicolinate synthase [Aerococcus sp. UMB1112A]OFN02327.1 4-hydroxy-tetrahydrodipicolinate synthase [Aerococcus sp. HMSC062A02]